MKPHKQPPGASCDNCVDARPFVVKPGIGPQDAETTRACVRHGFAVGVSFYCPKWKRA